jgi:hypothetical protein
MPQAYDGEERHCQINFCWGDDQVSRRERDTSLSHYAAMVVPVISRQVWKRCAICWRYLGVVKR